jgi:hypothetical protein
MCIPVCGREKEKVDVERLRDASGVPPCMCCVAYVPPTASKEPAACRNPDVDIEAKELALGEAKNAEPLFSMVVEVSRPAPVSMAISGGVKAVLGIVVDVGLASIISIYLSNTCLAICRAYFVV